MKSLGSVHSDNDVLMVKLCQFGVDYSSVVYLRIEMRPQQSIPPQHATKIPTRGHD